MTNATQSNPLAHAAGPMTPARFASLQGRPVFVTGGGSGIGAAIVEAFVTQGARVAFVDVAEQASAALATQFDNVFVHFQFGDRVSQMLSIISNDMLNFARWVADHPRATQSDAADWLAALDASYTMEEQRSHHHGNVHVQHNSGVEFF